MGPRAYAVLFLLLQLHVGLLSAAAIAPEKQRGCLQECGLCAACVRKLPLNEGCATLCVLCDICHACFPGEVCQWEVQPVPQDSS